MIDGRARSFCDSGDSGLGCTSREAEASTSNMTKSLTTQTFGVPSHGVLEVIDKVARLSEAGYGYETRVRDLEHQFEFKAAELREEYLSIVLQIHESPER
jgi:hypothetical protein